MWQISTSTRGRLQSWKVFIVDICTYSVSGDGPFRGEPGPISSNIHAMPQHSRVTLCFSTWGFALARFSILTHASSLSFIFSFSLKNSKTSFIREDSHSGRMGATAWRCQQHNLVFQVLSGLIPCLIL